MLRKLTFMYNKNDLQKIAQDIHVFFCDSDGVMFPNSVVMGTSEKTKMRSYYDGQGVSLLRAIGIHVVFITNEKGNSAAAIRETVQRFNSLPSSKPQTADGWEPVMLYEDCEKLEVALEYLKGVGFTLEQAAFMGDDLVDVPLLKKVALPAAPAQAESAIKDLCSFVSSREGGAGAIRDFANMILEARQINPLTLPPQ